MHAARAHATRRSSWSWSARCRRRRSRAPPSRGAAEQLELDGSLAQSLILLVSEVVSNAVRHSAADPGAPIGLVASFDAETIRVTVTDAGDGFTPRPRDPGPHRTTATGCTCWRKSPSAGASSRDGDTKVWFELPRSG